MQIEHKTEKGTLYLLKIEDDAFDIKLSESKLYDYDFVNFKTPHRWDNFKKRNWRWGTHFEVGKWQLIGLTSEVTELQCKMMVGRNEIGEYKSYREHFTNPYFFGYDIALESFKSLMQHLQVYEVNPCSHPSDIEPTNLNHYNYISEKWLGAQSRTGKWVTLFKKS